MTPTPAATPDTLPRTRRRPSPGTALANWALVATTIVTGLIGLENDLGPGRLLSFLFMAFLGFAFVALFDGVVSLLWWLLGRLLPRLRLAGAAGWLRRVPPGPLGRVIGVFLFIAGDMLWPDSVFQYTTLPPVGEIAIVVAGACGVLLALARGERPARRRARYAAAGALTVAYLAWALWPGTARGVVLSVAEPAPAATAPLADLPDPSRPGPFAVETAAYGSGAPGGPLRIGADRPEFAADPMWTTAPVDGSALFDGYGAPGDAYFRAFWGFGWDALPLNGLVWAPVGDGPFPLVLIVHGNHVASEPSDPGYAYLGEHLASHGYVVVSVDENFLNGLVFIDGRMAEMPLRAWLLLQHLVTWRAWSETPGHPFYGRVDLDRVALIGHSRGGEAAAVAAELNQRVTPPVSAVSSAADFGFGIDAVVAIAPSDGHFAGAGRPPTLSRSNYLLLAGGHDADTYVLYGQAQYNRVSFTHNPDGFKALAYVYRANHGQFNSVWADRDRGWLNSLLLNRRPLLPAETQRAAARLYITAFLEAAMRDAAGYRALFANPGAGAGWLPDVLTVTQFEARDWTALDTNRPNTAPERMDRAGDRTWAQGVTGLETRPLTLRDGATAQQNSALYAAWAAGSAPIVGFDVDPARAPADAALTFALAPADDTPVAVTIELLTADGRAARLPLATFAPVYPPLPARLLKAGWLAAVPGYDMTLASPVERVLQTYTVPLDAWATGGAGVSADEIVTIRFRFDGATAGAVYMDQIGWRSPATAHTDR